MNANLSLGQIDNPEVKAAAEDLLLVSDVKYIITNVTTKGFEIKMDHSADSDIPFSWQAVAVRDPKTFGQDAAENLAPADGANQNPAASNLELSADQPAALPPDAAEPSPARDTSQGDAGGPVTSAPADNTEAKPPT